MGPGKALLTSNLTLNATVNPDSAGYVQAAAERSADRYFQRPDRKVTSDGLFSTRHDTTATALRGYGLFTRAGQDNGTLEGEAMANVRSPEF